MRPNEVEIVFDVYPPYAKGKYNLTVGKPYSALKVDDELGLYSMVDDSGVTLKVSTYGAGYTNGGCWHMVAAAD